MKDLIEIYKKRKLMLATAQQEVTTLEESIELTKQHIGSIWVLHTFGYHGTLNGYAFASTSYQEVVYWCEAHPTWMVDTQSQTYPIVHEIQPIEAQNKWLVGRILERTIADKRYENALECLYERLLNE